MLPVCHKIYPGGVNNQDRKIGLLGKKGKVTLPDIFQIIGCDGLLVISSPLPDIED